MQQASKMNVHITLGSEDNLHFIANTNITVTSNPNYVILLPFRSKTLSINLNSNKIQETILSQYSTYMSNKENKKKLLHTSTKHLTKLSKRNKCHPYKKYSKDLQNNKELFKLSKILDVSSLNIDSLLKHWEIRMIFLPFKINSTNLTRQLLDFLLLSKVESNTITITEQMLRLITLT